MDSREGMQGSNINVAVVKEQLRQVILERKKAGLVPYEGEWLPRETVREKLKAEEKKSIGHAMELTVFFIVVLLLAAILVALLWGLAY